MLAKTFRLFISSTFNEFHDERDCLHETVFPVVEQYCLEKGFVFQSIDLRWGIYEETQLDQKTMDVCREEIRICKRYPRPNFLILVGQRYGWIPLPYRIDHPEFEEIIRAADFSERDALSKWYRLDENQMPAAYMLTERRPPYEQYDEWEKEEAILRTALQSIVQKIDLPAGDKEKYFQSATEQEAIEGLEEFYSEIPNSADRAANVSGDVDSTEGPIFAFFKEIDNRVDDKAYDNAVIPFRARLKAVLPGENIATYPAGRQALKVFKARAIELLKNAIDGHAARVQSMTPLEEEKLLHEYFRREKVRHFTGREETLEQIQQYLRLRSEAEPLILYAESGIGKSALIAKAIEQTNVRTIFRFVGITPHSSNTQQLLISIIQELDTNAMSPEEIEMAGLFAKQKGDALYHFSYQVFPILYGGIDKPVVIFIDGLDQLENYDEILWLPKTLPPHVKIILTTLYDKNYPQASQYFETLCRKKFTNLIRLPEYRREDAQVMLAQRCAAAQRTLQPWQTQYVLSQFDRTHSPLYLQIAVELAKNWKSTFEPAQSVLADDTQGVIRQYFSTLHQTQHHHLELVRRVAGYLVASVDGLSETELLELLAADETFLNEVAPKTYHDHKFKKLPSSIWVRLLAGLSPFLQVRRVDGYNLYRFFHREFNTSVREQYGLQTLVKELIERTQTLLEKHRDQTFNSHRYGRLYARLITHYRVEYSEYPDFFTACAEFPANLSDDWQDAYLTYCKHRQITLSFENRGALAIAYGEAAFTLMKMRAKRDPELWKKQFLPLMANMANDYRANNKVDKAIELDEENLSMIKTLFEQDEEAFLEPYIVGLQALASSYSANNRVAEALRLDEEAVSMLRPYYKAEPKRWEYMYALALNSLAISYKNQNRLLEAIKLEEEALELHKKRYEPPEEPPLGYLDGLHNLAQSYRSIGRMDDAIRLDEEQVRLLRFQHIGNPEPWADHYAKGLNQLSISYSIQHRTEEALESGEAALKIIKPMYIQEPLRWVSSYVASLINLGSIYHADGKRARAIELNEMALDITADEYQKKPEQWAKEYTLLHSNLMACYIETDSRKAVDLGEKGVVALRSLYERDADQWAYDYLRIMLNLGYGYSREDQLGPSIAVLQQALQIVEPLYRQNPLQWIELFNGCLLNLSASHYKKGDIEGAIRHGQLALQTLEPHYRHNPPRWAGTYKQLQDNLTTFINVRHQPDFRSSQVPDNSRTTSNQPVGPTVLPHTQHFFEAKKLLEKKWPDKALKAYEAFLVAYAKLDRDAQQEDVDWYAEALLDIGIIYHERNKVSIIPAHDYLHQAYGLMAELYQKNQVEGQLLWKATYYYVAELAKSLPISFFGWRNKKDKFVLEIHDVFRQASRLFDPILERDPAKLWQEKTTRLLAEKKL